MVRKIGNVIKFFIYLLWHKKVYLEISVSEITQINCIFVPFFFFFFLVSNIVFSMNLKNSVIMRLNEFKQNMDQLQRVILT